MPISLLKAGTFSKMKRYLGKITDRALSANLKELEADGLVVRKEYPQVPTKVEYSLSGLGESLMEVLGQLCAWGEAHMGTGEHETMKASKLQLSL